MWLRAVVLVALVALQGAFALPQLAPHPRIILTPARLAAVKGFVATNAQAKSYFAALEQQGDYVLSKAPLPRPPENASDILMAARTVLTRVTVTSLLYRLTDNATYAARAAEELLSIAAWSDWDIVKHALDAGELSLAAAVGLDWLYDYLSSQRPADLAAIVAGIVSKSGLAFRAAYEAGPRGSSWWTCDASNWAIVTNGGAGVAALAVLGEEGVPAWYSELLANASAGVRCSATGLGDGAAFGGGYAPDGAWWEGPIYAGYSDRYFVPFASAYESATGSGEFFDIPGVALAARYQTRVLGPAPAYEYFNWADSSPGQETLAMLLAVAGRFNDSAAAFTLRDRLDAVAPTIRPGDIDSGGQQCMEFAHALIYFTDIGAAADRDAVPLDIAIPEKRLALLRSSWSDADASFVGLKGCNCSWNHGDLDAGSFVFSWGGQRWISDLGAENYGLSGYFGDERFLYYRKNSHGHNTLTFANATQVVTDCGGARRPGPAPPAPSSTWIGSFGSASGEVLPAPPGHAVAACAPAADEQSCATVDLAPAYQGQGAAPLRRVALLRSGALRVTDSWLAAPATRVAAAMHTLAAVAVAPGGRSATLSAGGRKLSVDLGASCAGAALVATAVRLPPPQYSTVGLTRLDVVAPDAGACGAAGGFDVVLAGIASE
jgi:hypothetical protein